MTDKILIQALLDGVSHRKDGSLGVRFLLQEMSAQDKLVLIELLNTFGWVCFSPSEVEATDIPETQADDTRKTPSKRLRDVLFVLYKQGEQLDSFDLYYRQKMEKFIEHIKGKLND